VDGKKRRVSFCIKAMVGGKGRDQTTERGSVHDEKYYRRILE